MPAAEEDSAHSAVVAALSKVHKNASGLSHAPNFVRLGTGLAEFSSPKIIGGPGSTSVCIAGNILAEPVESFAVVAGLVVDATEEHVSAPVGLPVCGLPPPCSPKEKNGS